MSVWNRPMFKGSFPPGSARGALQRMRMQEGGNPAQEGLGMVSPEAMAQRQRMLDTARYQPVSADLRPMAPATDPMQAQIRINQAAFPLVPVLLGAGALLGGGYGLSKLMSDDEEREPFRAQFSPADVEADRQAAEQPGASEEDPAITPYASVVGRPGGSGDSAAASEEAAPIDAMTLASMYSFTPEERADRLLASYEGREAVYDQILGDPERRRDNAKAQLLFSIAQRALQFAGGVTAEGQPMRGSMVSQAAQSFAPVFGDIAEYNAAMETQDQELRAARLAAAEKDVSAQETLRGKLFEAALKAQGEEEKELRPLSEAMIKPEAEEVSLAINQAFNFGSAIKQGLNKAAALFNAEVDPEAAEAVRAMQYFNTTELLGPISQILTGGGRSSNQVLTQVEALLPKPGDPFSSVPDAVSRYKAVRNNLESEILQMQQEYEDFRRVGLLRDGLTRLTQLNSAVRLHSKLDGIINALEGNVPELSAQELGNVVEEDSAGSQPDGN